MENHTPPPPYIVRTPERGMSPFVFAAPHSGRFYPPDFTRRTSLDDLALRQSEDAYVDQLFEGITAFGGTQLIATHARAYLDLNRGADELEPAMFSPSLDEADLHISHRVKAGLGLIPSVIAEGVPIYSSPLPAREAAKRRDTVHTPYHQKLAQLLKERRERFGVAYLIDCHSMPSEGPRRRGRRPRGPDIVLGDSWGSACERDFTSLAEEVFLTAGFRVRRNVPYSGGYSTVNYGSPKEGFHALQIEISRGIYLDETSRTPLDRFQEVQHALIAASKAIVERTMERARTQARRRAAE